MKNLKNYAFTLVEILIVLSIIGIISSILLVSFSGIRTKAKDAKRKAEVSQIGKFLTMSCYMPNGGAGEYDLINLANELLVKYPQFLSQVPKDPKTGNDTESKYIYIVSSDGRKCALYANLESPEEPVTLTITVPTPGGGKGVFKADNPGWNGTKIFYQYSN
ncbi:MAG: prepilin-type N-terminal cleavage/methylation domain-containing protein [Candidatus Nealsonbacteria bacterium]|nr:prepilin-type N-terminal cleavage/methylation domain-containing protein [Candidatus Nealsonbacteria bacterium]